MAVVTIDSPSKPNQSACETMGKEAIMRPKQNKSPSQKQEESQKGLASSPKRNNNPGIQVLHGRIYDSVNGKSCHQCRQKTKDFAAECKNQINNKSCPIKYCHKCLLNRYGEKAEVVSALQDWSCPKCRGICNCSLCMKKRGHQPTGILIRTAKANGFSSVSEMLQVNGSPNPDHEKPVKDMGACPRKRVASETEPVIISHRKLGKENAVCRKMESNLCPLPSASNPGQKSKKVKLEVSPEKHSDSVSNHEDGNASLIRKSRKMHEGQDEKNLCPLSSPQNCKEKSKKAKLELSQERHNDSSINHDDGNTSLTRKLSRIHKGQKEKYSKESISLLKENNLHSNEMIPTKMNREGLESSQNPDEEKLKKQKQDKLKENHDGGNNDTLMEETCPRRPKNLEGTFQSDTNCKISADPREKKLSKENIYVENSVESFTMENTKLEVDNTDTKSNPVAESGNMSRKDQRFQNNAMVDDILLPQGTELTTVDGIDLPPEDVGKALQFLEFCAVFGKVLDVKKGQPECLLKDMIQGRSCRRGKFSLTVQFHIHLISIIRKDRGQSSSGLLPTSGKNSWVHALKECISGSESVLKSLALDPDKGGDGYENLSCFEKLRILNALCDEILGTVKIRNWIDDQISEYAEKTKEHRERILDAKNKEKHLKQKMQDEIARAIIEKNGAPLSISGHEALISQIKREATQAHTELLESKGMLSKKNQAPDAVRTEPVYVSTNSCVYWRLKCFSRESDILVQDVGTGNTSGSDEKWFSLDDEQKKVVEKHIDLRRGKRIRAQRLPLLQSNELAYRPT